MQWFFKEKIQEPIDLTDWEKATVGFGVFEIRVLTYVSILSLFALNAIAIYYIGFSYIEDLIQYFRSIPIGRIIISVVAFVFFYYVIHEFLHLLFHPDNGLSNKTLIGVIFGSPFVMYNGSISRRRFLVVIASPFIILLILYLVVFATLQLLGIYVLEIILVNVLLIHLSSSVGDALLFYKIYKLKDVEEIWNSYSSLWIKREINVNS